jgi:3-oxoacyl-[acyl-carrier-protein] synthase I
LSAAAAPLASLLAWEAVTSLGESAAETALLLRAGLSNVTHSRFIDATGERIMMCTAPAIPPHLVGPERAAALSQLALSRLTDAIETPRRSVLLIAVPERYATDDGTALSVPGRTFLESLRGGLPAGLRGVEIELFPFGRAAGAVALRRAVHVREEDHLVIWGGADTWHDWPALEMLERQDRLMTVANIDGVRPGEAAAFVLLGPASSGSTHIVGVGTGREPHPIGSEEPCRSLGLSDALAAAVAPLRAAGRRTNFWLLDNTHEAYATQELQNIIARFGDVLGLQTELQMPLKELGDVGAAAMPLLTVLGAESWRLGYANDDAAVVTGCSPDGARGAIMLRAHDGFRPPEKLSWAS